jgi:hypothetical protein
MRSKDYFEYKLTGYNALNKNVNMLSRDKAKMIWITDLNFNQEQINKLTLVDERSNIVYIDHHTYTFDAGEEFKKISNVTARIDQRYCGTLNTFLFLSNLSKNKKSFWNENKTKLIELNKIIDIYDRWLKDDPLFFEKALPLNDLFWEYGYEKFFKKFRNGYILDSEDLEVINNKNIERKTYLEESYSGYSIKCKETKSLFILNPNSNFTNDFTLFYPNFTFYVILKECNNEEYQFSIRISADNDFSVLDIFEKIKERGIEVSCGGHIKAGGITVNKKDLDQFMDEINDIFGLYVNL